MGLTVSTTKKDEQLVNCTKHETSIIDLPCKIGEGTVVWQWTHIREESKIGKNCMIGQGCCGSSVNKSVPSYSMVVGNPAKKIKDLIPNTYAK